MSRGMNPEIAKKVRKAARRYWNKHKEDYIGSHSSHLASKSLEEAAKQFKVGYGIEGFCWSGGREGISYVNMGDTYDLTVYFDTRDETFNIGCWGDVVEQLSNEGIELE